MNEYQEKIRTIGVSLRRGTSERKSVTDERDGTLAGHHDVHWDGSQDAHAIAKPAKFKAQTQEGR